MSDSHLDSSNFDINSYHKIRPVREVDFNGKSILFDISSRGGYVRSLNVLTREPTTIEWLSRLSPKDVLFDVGANMGTYSLIGAKVFGVRSYAFEPHGSNFSLLIKNIDLNQLTNLITPYCISMWDETKVTTLYCRHTSEGGSLHSIDESVDRLLQPASYPFLQGSLAMSGDDFIRMAEISPPTALKVDVDGFDHKVLCGFAQTLKSDVLRTISIELRPELAEHRDAIELVKAHGFQIDTRLEELKEAGGEVNIVFNR